MRAMKDAAQPLEQIHTLPLLLKKGSFGEIAHALRRRVYSDARSLGLLRDLATPFAPPPGPTPADRTPVA